MSEAFSVLLDLSFTKFKRKLTKPTYTNQSNPSISKRVWEGVEEKEGEEEEKKKL